MPAVIARAAFDCPDVQTLRRQLSAHYLETYGASDLDDDRPRDFYPPNGACLIARVGGRAVGMVSWRRFNADTAEAMRLYVVPELRGAGVAKALADAVQGDMAAAGCRRGLALTDTPGVVRLAHEVVSCTRTEHGDSLVCRLSGPPRGMLSSMSEDAPAWP